MHGTLELSIITLFAAILIIGAATRSFSRLSGVPFTIMMLILGFLGGLYIRYYTTDSGPFAFFHTTDHHSLISPELILFIFLPMLIFESAFSLDAHIFKKSLSKIVLLAGPALLLAAGLTAVMMLYIIPETWNWTIAYALLFGALINATDPVAVVALLRELGISKNLVTLIEGESLLNDGTAIVLFTVFLTLSLSGIEHLTVTQIIFEFITVVAGGLIIGVVLAWLISHWIGRIFNDPLVEITLMVALAYLAMIIAEGVFHVSGIMALVVAGLYMSSTGRTRISPEVMKFSHEFWEMMAYVANTLIFFLVGLVSALQIEIFSLQNIGVAVMVYIGLMLIRLIVVSLFRPLFTMIRSPISRSNSVVVSWAGLRGAVSLALALMLSQTPGLDEAFRQQVLLLTVVIVLFTVIFNGATMQFLLRLFGMDKPSLSAQMSANLAKVSVLNNVKTMIDRLSRNESFRNVYWADIKEEVDAQFNKTKRSCDELRSQIDTSSDIEHDCEYWIRVLNIERASYWELFAQGMLSRKAVAILNHEIDLQLDELKSGNLAPPATRAPTQNKLYSLVNWVLQRHRILQKVFGFMIFENISLQFYLCHAEHYAAKQVLDELEALKGMDKDIENNIRTIYSDYRINSKSRLEEMRSDLPELTQALETYFAKRLTLNKEREGISDLLKHGIIDEGIARDTLLEVETQMHQLRSLPKYMKLPKTEDLIKEIPLFSLCSEQESKELADAVIEYVVLKGDYLFKEGDIGDSMYIIVRGALEIQKDMHGQTNTLNVLGGGEIVGEMALLSGQPRMASASARTTVTLLRINAKDFNRLSGQNPNLLAHTWLAYGRHLLSNMAPTLDAFRSKSRDEIESLIASSDHVLLNSGESLVLPEGKQFVFIISGHVDIGNNQYQNPHLQSITTADKIVATDTVHALML